MPLNLLRSPTPIFLPLTPFSSPTVLSPNTRISTKAHHFHPLTISKTFLALAHLSSPLSQSSYQEEVEEEEEDVIGDCLVFEEGAFDDPFLKPDFDARIPTKRKPTPVSEQSLIPEEWKEAQAEINMTKKEKRVIAKQLEFGSRLERNRVRREPPAAILDKEAYQSFKLSQLKPVVLDPPESPLQQEPVESSDGDGRVAGHASIGRAAPKDPRVGVADSSLEDIAKFLNSNEYQPGENGRQNSQGPRKLFTKEEKVLLNKKIPNLADATSGKWLPLHTLAASGEFYLVDKLLKHNVDINAADKDGLTALHRAILGKKQAITNYLLRESANPFVCDKEGATLMHYAVQVASIPTIKILLLYNVDINLPDDDGWTPLHLAVQTKRTDVVKLLLIKGADKTLKNQDGLTPLDLCLYSGQDVQTYELIKLLKELPKL